MLCPACHTGCALPLWQSHRSCSAHIADGAQHSVQSIGPRVGLLFCLTATASTHRSLRHYRIRRADKACRSLRSRPKCAAVHLKLVQRAAACRLPLTVDANDYSHLLGHPGPSYARSYARIRSGPAIGLATSSIGLFVRLHKAQGMYAHESGPARMSSMSACCGPNVLPSSLAVGHCPPELMYHSPLCSTAAKDS
jgi:hypothetical protein